MYEKTIILKFDLPANTEANTINIGTIIVNPKEGEKDTVQVPVTETWVIQDVYVLDQPNPDMIVKIIKNGRKPLQEILLSTQLISNPARTPPKPMVFGPGETLSIEGINLAKVGTAGATVTAYAKVVIYEEGDF